MNVDYSADNELFAKTVGGHGVFLFPLSLNVQLAKNICLVADSYGMRATLVLGS